MPNNRNLKTDDFLQKLKKVVRIVLYGLAINSQSDFLARPTHFMVQDSNVYEPFVRYSSVRK